MNVPDDLRYSTDHEWVRVEGDTVRVGITDYAQDALGDVVFIELPAGGSAAQTGESFGEVESTKSVSDLFAPIAGTITELNEALEAAPELVNTDPYGEGWLVVITPEDLASVDELLDAAAYRALIED